ncbi:MAG: hypothetical protein CVU00_02785 [Bacteroidetes bacterium HGW-Bacteroidetes-17]|nr:MAG: hypothetical protein CVU00_02785 [Bacteroidetes bacterium HGW-Bacteroidetes-17]
MKTKRFGILHFSNYKYIYYHALYWTLNVLFFTLIFWSNNNYTDFLARLHENAAFLPGGMLFTYFSVNYLIPKYFFKNKIRSYIFLQLLVLLVYPFFSNAIVTLYVSPIVHNTHTSYNFYNGFLSILLILVFDIVPLAGVKFLKQLRTTAVQSEMNKNDKLEAELKLREAELKLLKGQIHPHFLFNTLNNLYSLSIQKSEKTSEVIIKVADLLNYIIYDCRSERVSLEKELEFINSYIELEKLRYDESLKLHVSISGDFHGKFIAPMILHSFIENSFKHGASKTTGNTWIDIIMKVDGRNLSFKVKNSKPNEAELSNSGIGIENTKKRLELIYPERHLLVIEERIDSYSVTLEIQL